jgi:hypothetical protein
MSSQPSDGSGGVTVGAMADPVVEIITSAGLIADPQVHECAELAAAAHLQRFENRRADSRAVNRSTFLWALWRLDDAVRTALEQNAGRLVDFERSLGITGSPRPLTGPFELGVDLTRALGSFAVAPQKVRRTVTPALLGVVVLEDVVAHGGLLADRLRELGIDARAVLDALRRLTSDELQHQYTTQRSPLVRVGDVAPRRFGVQLAGDAEDAGPYVGRDIDHELDRLLREHRQVVTVVAPPVSGAIRAIYEALRRERSDDELLLLHELLDAQGGARGVSAEDLDRLLSSRATVVWVNNLRVFLDASPVFTDWFRRRGRTLKATLVVLLRPEDRDAADELGLLSDGQVELSGELSAGEQARARGLYGADITTVSALGAASRRAGVLRANYAADSAAAARLLDPATDDLGIRADVDMLAKLIASKDVHPPLSIGLFGPWGSGKSFLMRQVQLRIADLAERSRRTSDKATTGYLSEVVAVEFNAWQYAHGKALWAALINRVFEEIQEQLGGDERYRQVLREIADKNVSVAQAHERLDAARVKVAQSQPAAHDRVIQDVANDHNISHEATNKLTAGLNLDAATSQVSDLKHEYDRLISTRSRLDKGWSTATVARKVLVLALVAVGLAAVVGCILVPAALEQATALLTGLFSIMAAATQILRPVNQGLEQAAKLLRADDADRKELQQAQSDLDQATQELATAKASGLAGLYGYVSERTNAAEYRQHLGMAPMIRDDLKRLADMSRSDKGLPGIDRIVIFIDDLDRCPPSEVVRVLEAVNLLFGFELFVVLIAVDSRWLLRSLEDTFSEAFDANDDSAPTAQNYLEKIIQIPFWIQSMHSAGFERLVTTLAGEVDRTPDRRETLTAHGSAVGSDVHAKGALPSGQPNRSGEPGETEGGVAPGFADYPGGNKDVEQIADGREDDLNPEALRLTEEERDFMLKFLPLLGTPRAVKRFLNTYQLLRVSVDDVEAFRVSEYYKPVLILLALTTGTSAITDTMIEEVGSMTETNFAIFLKDTQAELTPRGRSTAWRPIAAACAGLPTETLTPEVIDAWLPKVARYSFHPAMA